MFPEDNEDLSQYVEMYESDSDFHDQLKARAIYNKIACPIQVMLESTLQFQPKDGSDEYNSDMKAHLAWTHSSSLYYKLGCLPWKLDAVREGVCYVGLVFKKLQDTGKQKGYACSAAQMFLDSGDGVVFRGNIGPWISKNEKTFHLDRTSAKALLSIAIDAYYDKHKSYPKELFIHGRTAFTNDEWNGFQDAANISPTTNLVGVAIREKSGLRLLKDNTDPKSQYDILRGLCLYVDEKSGYLWTKGFIPKTETANHLEVACPLHIDFIFRLHISLPSHQFSVHLCHRYIGANRPWERVSFLPHKKILFHHSGSFYKRFLSISSEFRLPLWYSTNQDIALRNNRWV